MIALGSKNKAKKEAVEISIDELFEKEQKLVAVEVEDSPDQPVGLKEAKEGALLRAKTAREQAEADIGIGIEGFVQEIEGEYFLSCFAAIVSDDSKGFGTSGLTRLTDEMQRDLPRKELGEVIVDVIGDDLREGKGAVGVLTNGEVDRPDFSYRSLIHAFSDFDR